MVKFPEGIHHGDTEDTEKNRMSKCKMKDGK
jgi:hypothetical protein